MTILNTEKLQRLDAATKGFSLVELSVSVAIIACLLAAVLKGQNLVADAKLQAIVSEITASQVAVNSFYAKYGQYPGDLAASTDNHGVAIQEWGTNTSYGDNNSKIEFINTSAVYEGYRLWQHLYFAGMLPTPYAGTKTTTAAVLGTDVPLSKSGGGYLFDYSSSTTLYDQTTANAYGLSSQNVMVLGTPLATTASPIKVSGILTPTQAMGIDTKMDDGVPGTGSVMGEEGVGATAGTCSSSTVYNITSVGRNCIMVFSAGNN